MEKCGYINMFPGWHCGCNEPASKIVVSFLNNNEKRQPLCDEHIKYGKYSTYLEWNKETQTYQ